MKKSTLVCLLFFCFSAYSQNDSTRLDVGGVVLKRAFTQNVSIKGEDLEKMPFSNLSEAINVWLYGTYTDAAHMIYVVDGNVVNDVNTYNIHDIKEVTLVQNAAALNSLGASQPQMLVITTRKGQGAFGIQGDAQTFLVHSPRATTNLYHQYYIGAYRNLEKVSFGFSANYLRDVQPFLKGEGYHYSTPYHLDRWRLNGYFSWRPDAKNTIEAHVGFTPQTIGRELEYHVAGNVSYNGYYYDHAHTDLLLPWVRWHGEWLPRLRNDLQVGLASTLQKGVATGLQDAGVDSLSSFGLDNTMGHSDHLYIRDRVSYTLQAGGWNIEPSINASYEHYKIRYSENSMSGTGTSPLTGLVTNRSSFISGLSANQYLLTPAVDLSYKQSFDIQGGFVANVSTKGTLYGGDKRVFPFASVTVDLLKLGAPEERSSLKLFGSYAQRGGFVLDEYRLTDMNWSSGLSAPFVNNLSFSYGSIAGTLPIFPVNSVKTYWVWQTGAGFTSRDGRWQVNYNFERMNFATLGWQSTPMGGSTYVYSEWKTSRHFLGVNMRIVDKGSFIWRSGLTTTVIRNKTNVYADDFSSYEPLGEHRPGNDRPSWTGGWTHRLQYKRLSLGLDMVYHFNKEWQLILPSGGISYTTVNFFEVQNVFISYKLHLQRMAGLEIYADSRGPLRSDKSNVLDQRRYYGVGGKITI